MTNLIHAVKHFFLDLVYNIDTETERAKRYKNY